MSDTEKNSAPIPLKIESDILCIQGRLEPYVSSGSNILSKRIFILPIFLGSLLLIIVAIFGESFLSLILAMSPRDINDKILSPFI